MTASRSEPESFVAQIGSRREARVFTLHEARELFPVVHRITHAASTELAPIQTRLQNTLRSDPRLNQVSAEYEAVVTTWLEKMGRLGLVVGALWRVEFDTGDGYLCWKYPEHRLGFYRTYAEDFADRRPIDEVIELGQPDWAL